MYAPRRQPDTSNEGWSRIRPTICWPARERPSPEPGLARKHDETYKLIFSQRAAVEELVRNFVGEDLAAELDFDTLEALPTDRISGGLVQRQVDLLWKIRFRGSWLYLLILLEFQSESDHFMALRILTYICLTYEELLRRKEVRAGRRQAAAGPAGHDLQRPGPLGGGNGHFEARSPGAETAGALSAAGAAFAGRPAEDRGGGSALEGPSDFARQSGGEALAREPPAGHA